MNNAALLIAVLALSATAAADSGSRANDDASRRAAAAAAAADDDRRRALEDAQRVQQLGFDPARIRSVGLWQGKSVQCKLPKREQPYACRRVLDGPAVILSRLPHEELFVARGDEAAARGDRAWWITHDREPPVPLALGPGEVLYVIGDLSPYGGDTVVTLYR